MKSFLLSFFLLISLTAISQTYYPLHPSVGDTIDRLEKLDYSLFPSIPNTEFGYALIQFKDDSYQILVSDQNGKSNLKKVSKEQLIEAQQNIEKINAYYKRMASEKLKDENKADIGTAKKSIPIRIEGPMSEQMRKEARMNIRLREDSRRQREVEQGLRHNEVIFEFN